MVERKQTGIRLPCVSLSFFLLAPPSVDIQEVHDVDTFMTEAVTQNTLKHTLSSNKQ